MSLDASSWTDAEGVPVVRLLRWRGEWSAEDPDANFRAEVADYTRLEPLTTVSTLASRLEIPVGALVRYVLARWATGGSAGLLELGPTMVRRMWEPVRTAEEADSDEHRLAAYHQLRQMLSWLKVPLDDPTVYPVAGE
ncbi:hypothetical protein ThrDRAFT_04434 [Frankia casuarinae]|jgi:hypothetical protein|uniref:Uncharacterized protein n=1 Tax=Frankia casuarinae (strain DSM 45818 / CECT 9043 / HFP020203 / CcI3) TaxID=106370 RepID=Q2JC50_FRACC|nr:MULTISPECIES: DUF6027 family protein [Frankia]ABD11142.1 hypothetical protein Francci3_1766 [Frankia casuarinae]ETA00796.1 hypothetical protein CcI6DRAFT_03737 [Frankia sp. CcI6]EYT89953.1 hypothetical protein ThrDRAFT_04434 [Frankia casuarinae]KFB03350.1 hypothetical protein ALLO2DRAFT_03854 [Frankia sp. Allo2]OAA21508.1 hypothetical protein AAY23_107647 [Frankia casuarinae]